MRIGFDAKWAFENFTALGKYTRGTIRVLSENHPGNDYLLYTAKVSKKINSKDLLAFPGTEIRTPAKIISRMQLGNIWRSTILGNAALSDGVQLFHGLTGELPIITNKRLKTIVTIHDLMFIRFPQYYAPLDIEILKRRMKHACKVANKIIAISRQTAGDISNFFGISPEKIRVIYPPWSPEFSAEQDPFELKKIIDRYQLPEDFILTAGEATPQKNTRIIVEALATVKGKLDIPLVILGKSDRKYKSEIIKLANQEKINNSVVFLDQVPPEDYPKIYQLSKLFVYPSLLDGFAVPVVEALNARVPAIISKGYGFEEAGGPHSVYFRNNDPEDLADAIIKVLNNTQLAGRMIARGEEYVKQFSGEKIAANLIQAYEEVLYNVATEVN